MKKTLFSSNYFLTWTLASLIILTAQREATGAQTFQDATFNTGDWNAAQIPVISTSGANFTPTKDPASGTAPSGPPSRMTVHNYPAGGDIFVAHLHIPSSYNPANGAIVTLTFSYDAISYTPLNVAYSLLVKQGGTYYIRTPEDYSGAGWAHFGAPNLTAADFIDISNRSSGKHPDFTCAGPLIELGYVTRNHNPHSAAEQTKSAIDNWQVIINTSVCSTPTPTATPTATATATPTPAPTGCATISDKDIHCQPDGSYSYTVNVANNSGGAMSQVLLTPAAGSTFTLSSQLSNLSSPLPNGQSTTVTTNIGNASPGDKVCFFVSLMSDSAPCCTMQVCATLPQCGENPNSARQRPGTKGRR